MKCFDVVYVCSNRIYVDKFVSRVQGFVIHEVKTDQNLLNTFFYYRDKNFLIKKKHMNT